MLEHLPVMHEALDSVLSTTEKKEKKTEAPVKGHINSFGKWKDSASAEGVIMVTCSTGGSWGSLKENKALEGLL